MDAARLAQIRNATNGNCALGSERFQKQIEAALGRRAVHGAAGRPKKEMETDERQKSLL